jgi:hypothetical protein
MAVVTARRGWRVTLRWRIVVRPLPSVFADVIATAIAAVIAAVIAAIAPLLPPLLPCFFSAVDAGCCARLSRFGFISTSWAFSKSSSNVSNRPFFPAKGLILVLIAGRSPAHAKSYNIRDSAESSSSSSMCQPASLQLDRVRLSKSRTDSSESW